ncbi:PIN domain-like protein [Sanghuangporus baumii]|uniref:PIN domain-like protein n=1 Tax=Sanghuangporus baumii TaxID=108892 RepID=A0A9Q5HSV7_SANBA|nr:PIN domain-like protein [Sanghuangporus baumii]
MRDKEGRGLVNAHVLGFLRRICKLLFHGIKPVFVFDGGAPALKRMTIAERKKKKSGAAESHEKIAQKLLAAQLRKEALSHAQSSSKDGNRPPQDTVTLDDDTVYLEDLDASAPRTPAKTKGKAKESPSSSAKKAKWRDHDPYRLPEVDMDAAVAKATRSTAPDPRLATEDELREFIEMMRPEDLDVSSPAFRELPTEVQYEIIGDLRLKSRQTSHKRLQAMLRKSRTALDFSRQQIQLLKQRNALTQQLLETTDSMGKANVTIPIRIASERNREYVLMKNEDEIGGWVLGIRDDGTEDKPIVLDNADEHINSDQESDDDIDMEEVAIRPQAAPDPDLREYRRELALAGVEKRQAASAARGRPAATMIPREKPPKKEPLFIPDADAGDINVGDESDVDWEDVEDAELVTAMQASLEDQEANDLRTALEESRKATSKQHDVGDQSVPEVADSDDDDLYVDFTPSRLDTALRFAYASREPQVSPPVAVSRHPVRAQSPSPVIQKNSVLPVQDDDEDEDDDMEAVVVPIEPALSAASQSENRTKDAARTPQPISDEEPPIVQPILPVNKTKQTAPSNVAARDKARPASPTVKADFGLDQAATEISTLNLVKGSEFQTIHDTNGILKALPLPIHDPEESVSTSTQPSLREEPEMHITRTQGSISPTPSQLEDSSMKPVVSETVSLPDQNDSEASSDDEAWPHPESSGGQEQQDGTEKHDEGWDAAEEMNVHEETGEFARFAAQVRGRDLDTVRAEIDDEIRLLRDQRKAAMRDAEDVNQAMVAQIMTMLRLFGIPYITAPMEAEAQCATLVELGLVDGVITDDSDVFLFGAKRVFKNMFNQSKTVECFLLTDLARELGLDRGTLIRLAYLLGSDYTSGLAGVGPVVAMELLREFPGDDGLHKFMDWWSKVQSGRDKESDNASAFRKRFKKRFKDLFLASDWPNPAVRDAYYHPIVDTSEEPFNFFHEELGWNIGKVDELLLPIIQKMNKRGQEAAANRQGTLNTFFNVSEGAGAAEPRRREAYASRRLQALVSAHRKAQKQRAEGTSTEPTESGDSDDAEKKKEPARKKRKKASSPEGDESTGRTGANGSRQGKGKGRRSTQSRSGRGGKTRTEARGEDSVASSGSRGKKAKPSRPKAKGKSKKRADSDAKTNSSDEFVGVQTDAPVREMELRKRVRPRPAYKGTVQGENGDDKTGDDGKMEYEGVEDEDSGSDGSEYQG